MLENSIVKKKPVIGLTSSFMVHEDTEKVFLPHSYFDAVRHFGGIPLLIPVMAHPDELKFLLDSCDGLILTGGNDIDPARYGETLLNDSVVIAPERDDQESAVIDMALERSLPILGICRGLQMLNVHFGGSLYQDIPSQVPSDVAHKMDKPYHRTSHLCFAQAGTPLDYLCGGIPFGVNSHHHQAVKDLAPGFSVMGQSEDGIIEAICDPAKPFLWAVQWHPERIWDLEPNSARLFERFLDECEQKSKVLSKYLAFLFG